LNKLLIDYCQVHNIVKFNDKSGYIDPYKKVNYNLSFYIEKNNITTFRHYVKLYNKININDANHIFRTRCSIGCLEFIKFFMSIYPNIDIHQFREYAFRTSCQSNHFELVKFLWSLNKNINIHACNEAAFRHSCDNDRLQFIEFLITIYKQENNNKYLEILDQYPHIKSQLEF